MFKISLLTYLFFFSNGLLAFCPNLSVIDNTAPINLNNDISPRTILRLDRGDNSSDCRIRIGVDKGNGANYNRTLQSGLNSIDFNIAKNNSMNSILMLQADSQGKKNLIEERFKKNKADPFINFDLFSELTLTGNELPGYYSGTYNIVLYQKANGNNYDYYGAWPITYFYNIPSSLNLSIVDSNQPFDEFDTSQDLSFGTIIQGDSKQFDIVVQTNNGYVLKVSSQNNGQIKHQNTSEVISYVFKVNSSPIDLTSSSSNPVTIGSAIGNHSGDGFRLPIQVEMGDPSNKLAGYYEDQITISVMTNL